MATEQATRSALVGLSPQGDAQRPRGGLAAQGDAGYLEAGPAETGLKGRVSPSVLRRSERPSEVVDRNARRPPGCELRALECTT